MGFDITFHPLSIEELKYFVFDIIKDPTLGEKRVLEITNNVEKQKDINNIYTKFNDMLISIQQNRDVYSRTIAFGIAAIAGYLHPYWYARGSCISFLVHEEFAYKEHVDQNYNPVFDKYISSTISISPDTFAGIKDKTFGLISENYSAGAYVFPSQLDSLWSDLTNEINSHIVSKVFDDEGLESICYAIEYCRLHGSGFMEVSDITIPANDISYTDYEHIRAHYLDNINNMKNINR